MPSIRLLSAFCNKIGTERKNPAPQQFRPVTELLSPCLQSSQHARLPGESSGRLLSDVDLPRCRQPAAAIDGTFGRTQSWDCGRHYYCYFFLGVGFERQYVLRFTLPLASLLSATQLQSLRALQAASSFKELHAGGCFAGAFLS
jgi:hypothetical protein